MRVWRGTHGGLWFPLRQDARFGVRVYHTTCNLPPPPTHPCTRIVLHVPLTGTPTYAQKSWGGHTRCDLAPLTTSFGTVGQWERQHLAMAATCPEGEAWAASRNWNHGTHFLWDPRAAPTFHPLSTLRHRAQCRTCQPPRSTLVLYSGKSRVVATRPVPRPQLWRQWWRYVPGVMSVCGCSSGSSLCVQKSVGFVISHSVLWVLFSRLG